MQTKVLTGALIFLALFFIAFVWWVWYATEAILSIGIPITITVLPIFIAVIVFIIRRIQARRGSRQLEAAISGQGAAYESGELLQLRREFDSAVAALKKTKLARGSDGRDALYRLPWYVIIGPPACGKTTVLRNSGLRFPDVPGMGQRVKVKGIGGTRNCDWFLSNRAVILDTAGRWTVEDDDRDEWMTFLDLLKRHRPKRPLNGIIAAINVDELATAESADVEALANNIRQRIDEVISRLGVSLPVYVLFTKCDLIRGFVELFSDMSRHERDQIWGFTAPLSKSIGGPAEYFEACFDELYRILERRTLKRLPSEGNPTTLRYIYEFPIQFRSLRDNLSLFMSYLFEESVFQETPILRGCYFTSGTQEGAPADLLMNRLAGALRIHHLLPDVQPETQPKAYFLHDMLMKVVFEDQNIAAKTRVELARQRTRTILWTSIVFFAAALCAVIPGFAFVRNNAIMESTGELINTWNDEQEYRLDAPVEVKNLKRLHSEFVRYKEGRPSFWTGFGMYHGDEVFESLRGYYGNVLKEYVIRPLLARDNIEMRTLMQRIEGERRARGGTFTPLNSAEHKRLLNQVMLQLLLSESPSKEVPNPMSRKKFILDQIVSHWQASTGTSDKTEIAFYRHIAEFYLDLLRNSKKSNGNLTVNIDKDTLLWARGILSSKSPVERAINGLMTRFESHDQNLTSLVGGSVAFQSSAMVPGAFTREAWQNIYQMIENGSVWDSVGEQWVFASISSHDSEKKAEEGRKQRLRDAYFRRYQQVWKTFIDQLSVKRPGDINEATQILQELAQQDGVLSKLLQSVKSETELPDPGQPIVKAIAEKVGEIAKVDKPIKAPITDINIRNLADAFRSFTSFSQYVPNYQAQLQQILIALKSYSEDSTKFEALKAAVENGKSTLEGMIVGYSPDARTRWEKLLRPPLEGLDRIVNNIVVSELESLWCAEVYAPFNKELTPFYPFSNEGDDASIESFENFFRPEQGKVWAFFNKYLNDQVVSQSGSGFGWTRADGVSGKYRKDLLVFYRKAAEVTDVFFQQGRSANAILDFEVKIYGANDLQKTELVVGGKSIPYYNGTLEWIALAWPGEDPQFGASLKIVRNDLQPRKDLTRNNVWGLFRLLGKGRIKSSSQRQFKVFWQPPGSYDQQVAIEFRFRSAVGKVFGSRMFSIRPPSRILTSGSGCRGGG